MNLFFKISRLTAVAAAILAAGCASFGGIAPQAKLSPPESLGATGSFIYPSGDWWTAYGDPELDQLIARALSDSPTMHTAQARLDHAQAAAEVAGAARYPQLSAEVDSSRQRLSKTYIYPPPLGGSVQSLNTASLNASWELDLFGHNRVALDAAVGSARAAAADREAARVLLAAKVAGSYFSLAQKLEQRAVIGSILEDREHFYKLVGERVGAGLDTKVELRQAQGTVPQARQELAALDEQIALNRHALAALIGADPRSLDALAPGFGVRLAPVLPANLPADLIGRRADIVAARWKVEAASRDIAAAKAEFYPNVNLTAFVGVQSLGLAQWWTSASRMTGIGPAIHLPIFEGGRLRGNLHGKTADYDAAVEDYNAKLIDALRDVADQLASADAIENQAREQEATLAATSAGYELAQQRYRAGLANFLSVLTAQMAVEQQRRGAVDLKARRYALDVELARALGGGFRDSEAAKAAAAP
jgi:NodT family efflux transporter outer membrane factor (OMF) lipoprotein